MHSVKECALAKRYIDTNYSQNITLDLLAEITHINKFYLAHSFTECIGQSPINYLADRRIEACKELFTCEYNLRYCLGDIPTFLLKICEK